MRALRVGLTGGIGSGKSTVAAMLADCGAAVIDSDAIARQVTAPGGVAMDQLARQFGTRFITPEGGLNRDAMRELVFADAGAKKQLEAIVHPLVGEETARLAARAASACIVFDVPLLVESGRWRQRVDQVLVVDCSEATQVSRVMARNGWTREAVERVMAGQASRDQRLAAADICIYNDAPLSLAALAVMVQQLSQRFGL
ncbi:dephospho-CoA kinase [Polaromonas sp. AET17H-212]|uniref:dephospho-CoA kinase n=1 Tax=Polaromonas sp. AET17H-212 TaxID=1977061 RepID=UPI000BBCF429|nr:dephospho-CoA kinase [Polaromonas sp. AET17H-212]